MRTGEVNLLEKLPQSNEAAMATRNQAVAKTIASVVILLSFAACFSVYFLMQNIPQNSWAAGIVYTCFGLIIGLPVASTALAILTVFDWRIRFIGLCTSIILSLFAFSAGIEKSDFSSTTELLTLLPIILLGCALPYLFVKHFLHWQIVFETLPEEPKRHPVSIAGMLIFTTVIAVSIASMQIHATPTLGVISMLVVAGVGFAFVLPLFRIQLLAKRPWLGLLATYFGTLVVVAAILHTSTELTALNLAANFDAIGFGHSAATGILTMGLLIVSCRLAGGRLAFGESQNPSN